MKYCILTILFLSSFLLCAQVVPQLDVPVTINGSVVSHGFNGGTNNPQLHRTDLNNDGILDLYYFDKVGNVSMPYLYDNSVGMNYQFAPAYAESFPDMQRFVLLRDYDGDGIDDIFALDAESGGAGMQVHKGMYVNDTLSFDRVDLCCNTFNVIYYEGNSGPINLLVPSTDYPAIDDMDGDGDLDILTFSQAGFKVDYFKNMSVERGFGRDSLQFIREDNCWGGFSEQGVTKAIDLAVDENTCASGFMGSKPNEDPSKGPKHAGSTISIRDVNGDGAAEAFLGDISYANITKLDNGGMSTADAWMNAQDNDFPSADIPVDISIFPASFFLDLDNDGLTDFVAASHNIGNTEDYESVWFYKNVGTETNMQFELQTKSAFVESSIDLGTGAHPTFVDENADGLLDIVVGNFTYYVEGGANDSRLFLFRNIGTSTSPAFELVDDNWLDFKALNPAEFNFSPTFGDIDMDGDLDLLVGSENGQLLFAENTSGANNPMTFGTIQTNYASIDVGIGAAPFLYDINDDNFPDLLIGERSGNVNFHVHNGTGAGPSFDMMPDEGFFGMFDVRQSNGFGGRSTPAIIEVESELLYFSGSESGNIFQYKDVSIVDNTSTLVSEEYESIKAGWNTHPALADINGDGKVDLLLGNQRGGLTLFTTNLVSNDVAVIDIDKIDSGISIYPNPSTGIFNILIEDLRSNGRLEIYQANGQLILNRRITASNEVDLSSLPEGVYFFKMVTNNGVFSKRVLKLSK